MNTVKITVEVDLQTPAEAAVEAAVKGMFQTADSDYRRPGAAVSMIHEQVKRAVSAMDLKPAILEAISGRLTAAVADAVDAEIRRATKAAMKAGLQPGGWLRGEE